jgi:uncharacterized protein YegP (UPF0339 family)
MLPALAVRYSALPVQEIYRGEGVEKRATFIIYRDFDRAYRWRLRSSEGVVIASSESGRPDKSECVKEMEHWQHQWPKVLVRDTTDWNLDKQPFSQWRTSQHN